MFSKKIALQLTTLLAALAMAACENDMTVTLNSADKRLVVSGEFTTDTTVHSLYLSRSGSIISGRKQTAVTGAKVYVTNKVDTIYFVESKGAPGLYQTPTKCYAVGGQTYYLSITGIDVDEDGKMDSFSSVNKVLVAIKFDSLSSKYGLNGDSEYALINIPFYQRTANGPDYAFSYMMVNDKEIRPLSKRLGTGEVKTHMTPTKHYKEGETYNLYFSLDSEPVAKGDRLTFIAFNFTEDQYKFLTAFDNNTDGDPFLDNMYDQLVIPSRLPTNIEPANKAGGYFLVYSISRISRVYK
jgi:hypothetical protein